MKKYIFIILLMGIGLLPRTGYSERFLWCWFNTNLTNNTGSARSDLFNFCAAPFGDTTKAITYLYYYAEGDVSGSPANLRSFISDAHSHGLKVVYLDGDPARITSATQMGYAKGFLDAVMAFNKAGSTTQRFDGVQYDIEPNSASGWSSNESTYWTRFTTILAYCQASVNAYNLSYSPHMYFETVMRIDWDTDGDPITSNTQTQGMIDSVALMDFYNTVSNITTNALGEIIYADSTSKKVAVGFETSNQAGGAQYTFYGLPVSTMESRLATAYTAFSSHSSFWGYAFEYYDTYTAMSNPNVPPTAGFTGSPTSGAGPVTVNFTDSSGNTPTSWNWNFGDNGTSTTQNPSHQYAAVSTPTCYDVRLIATNAYGSSTITKAGYICVNNAPPSAGFSGFPTSGNGPLNVYFTDSSGNTPTSWNWNFGDGGTSTTQNPSHQYAAVSTPACYDVRLIATNAFGSGTINQTNFVCVSTTSGVGYQTKIIWDFDSTATTPTVFVNGHYVYTGSNYVTAGVGLGGSKALKISIPNHSRTWGGNIYIGNGADINLTSAPLVTWYMMAADTSSFGVAFEIKDTSGSYFVPNGAVYAGDSEKWAGAIPTGGFQKITWDVGSFHKYKNNNVAPDMAHLRTFWWLFMQHPKNTVQGSPTLNIYLDNITATGPGLPVELWSKY